jgi:hypothetical protein
MKQQGYPLIPQRGQMLVDVWGEVLHEGQEMKATAFDERRRGQHHQPSKDNLQAQCYKTFNGRNLTIFVLRLSVCPRKAFPAKSFIIMTPGVNVTKLLRVVIDATIKASRSLSLASLSTLVSLFSEEIDYLNRIPFGGSSPRVNPYKYWTCVEGLGFRLTN